jgi:hypothetical protein
MISLNSATGSSAEEKAPPSAEDLAHEAFRARSGNDIDDLHRSLNALMAYYKLSGREHLDTYRKALSILLHKVNASMPPEYRSKPLPIDGVRSSSLSWNSVRAWN